MDKNVDFWQTIQEIRTGDNRFSADAYLFVMQALEHTIAALGVRRHVSAEELLHGIVDYARRTYGMLSYSVLESWGIRGTADIGAVVFHLVDAGILARRECDEREDFDDVFDVKETLEQGYLE